jgi:hypothetical protein
MRTGDGKVRGHALNDRGAEVLAQGAVAIAATRPEWTVEIDRVPGYMLRLRDQDVRGSAPAGAQEELSRRAAELAWELLERTPGELSDHEQWDGDETSRAYYLSQFGRGHPGLGVGDLVRVTAPDGAVIRLGCGCMGWYDPEDEEEVAEAEACTILQASRRANKLARRFAGGVG